MSDTVITVKNLSKRYRVGHRSGLRGTTLREAITEEAHAFARKAIDLVRGRQIIEGDEIEDFWALRDVCFEVRRGDVIGIIGRNGAGKSTLLKVLSRITEPTEGRVVLRGRVASLLEVGTGFHPDLTGRENIFLNGAILGMTQREIRKKFDEIVAFSEIEKFLDTPVKRFSSGMHVRLAFAVAAHLEPEILIVDEVLALGDTEFQQKCLGKMDEVSRRDGRTVLFVSHNMDVVANLCPLAIWLDHGCLRRQGAVQHVIRDYLAVAPPSQERIITLDRIPGHGKGGESIQLLSLEWLSGIPLRDGEPVEGKICWQTQAPLNEVTIGIGFSNLAGSRLLTYEADFERGRSLGQAGKHCIEFRVDSLPLAPDIYSLDICFGSGDHSLDCVFSALQIEIAGGPKTLDSFGRKGAGVHLPSTWTWTNGLT
jgi:lipopolysaccharide transport system ATP-binding protein